MQKFLEVVVKLLKILQAEPKSNYFFTDSMPCSGCSLYISCFQAINEVGEKISTKFVNLFHQVRLHRVENPPNSDSPLRY